MVRRKISILLLCLLATIVHAQDGYKGKEFWLVFPQNARPGENATPLEQFIQVMGIPGTTGTAKRISSGNEIRFTISDSMYVKISLDTFTVKMSGEHNDTWLVETSDDVTILAVSHRSASTDSYIVLPKSRLGLQYTAVGYYPLQSGDVFASQFDVIATEDATTIRVDYPIALKKEAITLTLDRGEALHQSGSQWKGYADLTGTMVSADKPVAFLTGHACAQVPADVNFCDVLMEMLPPISELGTSHAISKLVDRKASTIRVVAVEDNTRVLLNGDLAGFLKKGHYYEKDLTDAAMIETSNPAYVAQYAQSVDTDSIHIADPFLMAVAPVDRFVKRQEISVPHVAGSWLHYINVVTTRNGKATLRLDQRTIDERSFNQIGSTDYFVSTVEVGKGFHLLRSEVPFIAYQYGYGARGYHSYGHLCGMK